MTGRWEEGSTTDRTRKNWNLRRERQLEKFTSEESLKVKDEFTKRGEGEFRTERNKSKECQNRKKADAECMFSGKGIRLEFQKDSERRSPEEFSAAEWERGKRCTTSFSWSLRGNGSSRIGQGIERNQENLRKESDD